MSNRILDEAWECKESRPSVAFVLVALSNFANKNGICWPSVPTLAKMTRMSERQVQRSLKALRDDGRLTIMDSGGGRGKPVRYKLTVEPKQLSLPIKGDISPAEKGDIEKGDTRKGDIGDMKRVTSETQKGDIRAGAIRKNPHEPPIEPPIRKTRAQAPFVLPDWIPAENWAGFEEMRIKKRAPMTDRARRMIAKELLVLQTRGHPPGAVLDQSVKRCWSDVFELKGNGNGTRKTEQHARVDLSTAVRAGVDKFLRGKNAVGGEYVPGTTAAKAGNTG